MNETRWFLNTHGDPLGKVRMLVAQIWREADLQGMLVTTSGENEMRALPRYITDVSRVSDVNPFKPLMEMNAARMIPGLLREHAGGRIGALLRPCEMRALDEMVKHSEMNLSNLLTISVDCLGTLPADEYPWRLKRVEKPGESPRLFNSSDELANEALRYARQGGVIPYRFRTACQVCSSPAAQHATLNIHILGLPVRQVILVSAGNTGYSGKLKIEALADGQAEADLVESHERLLSRMTERHAGTLERVNEGLGSLLPSGVEDVIRQLEGCGDCQACMDVCPICSIDRPSYTEDGHLEKAGVLRWLVSCAGCGMCEQTCPSHLPLSAIFGHIREILSDELGYIPGRSISEPLPLA